MTFENDKSVVLDCGCTAYAGDDYYHYRFNMYNPIRKTNEIKAFTCCADNDCLEKCIDEFLPFECSTIHIATKEDKEYQYGDMKYDDWR